MEWKHNSEKRMWNRAPETQSQIDSEKERTKETIYTESPPLKKLV
jgi:hypothetical protein